MRLLAIAPLVLCTVALILSFLCLFAGSKKGFMEDYAVITLNTSRIGENVDLFGIDLRKRNELVERATTTSGSFWSEATSDVGSAASEAASKATAAAAKATKGCGKKDDDGGLVGWAESELHNAECVVENKLDSFKGWMEDEIEDGINDLAQVLGVHDFYSAHIMNFCEGYYIPGPVPNNTVPAGSIHKNVTHCSNKTAMYHFDPTSSIATQLNESTDGLVDLTKIHWPSEVHDGLNALKVAQKVVFVLYCIGIIFIFMAMALAAGSLFTSRRLVALINFAMDGLAFLAMMIASALVTFIADHATHIINKYGKEVGISANKGNKFLALTWAATALVALANLVWIIDFFLGKKFNQSKQGQKGEAKNSYEMQERY